MSNALEILEARALGGACPRLSLVGGEGEQKQPGETNRNLQTRLVFVTERERAHSALGSGCPALPPGLELGAAPQLSWDMASPSHL